MFDTEPWAQQLDLQWEKRFEQRIPPNEDRVIQVDVGSQDHPKPISISEGLSLTGREELIALYESISMSLNRITKIYLDLIRR